MLISVVIPCYYSEKTIRKVVELVMAEFEKNDGYECEFVLVNDGSTDHTFEEIQKLGAQYPNVCGVNLMRNFGQHNALMAALHYAKGDYVLGMDDDLQTHPSQMFKLIHKIEEGYDLVYGVYPQKKNSWMKNLTSKINEVTSRVMLNRPREIVSSNFWIITRAVQKEVIKYDSFNPYIDGIFYRVTHPDWECTGRAFQARGRYFRLYIKKTDQSLAALLEFFGDSASDLIFPRSVFRAGRCDHCGTHRRK